LGDLGARPAVSPLDAVELEDLRLYLGEAPAEDERDDLRCTRPEVALELQHLVRGPGTGSRLPRKETLRHAQDAGDRSLQLTRDGLVGAHSIELPEPRPFGLRPSSALRGRRSLALRHASGIRLWSRRPFA